MLETQSLLIFVPTVILLVILPGPDFAIITKISLFNGKKEAQAASVGVTLGICVHTMLAMLGLSAIVASSAMLFNIIKFGGAIYLFYIGILEIIGSVKIKNYKLLTDLDKEFDNSRYAYQYLYTGFLVNVLNPKAILYFMVLYPQFINKNAPIMPQFLIMGSITAIIVLGWYLILASLFARIRELFMNIIWRRWLMRFTGIIFISFGLRLAIQKLE